MINIDTLLDSIHPKWMPGTARIKSMYKVGDQWHVEIAKPGGTGTGFTDEDTWHGAGPTRTAAVQQAVESARGADQYVDGATLSDLIDEDPFQKGFSEGYKYALEESEGY